MRAFVRMGLVSGLALVAACLAQPMEDTTASPEVDEPSGEAREALPVVKYEPEDFPFVTIIRDDGKGKAGGWQETKTKLSFKRWIIPHLPRHWECSLTIGMPLRTEVAGPIPSRHAATLSAQVAADVARAMDADYDLPPGIFCQRFVKGVKGLFWSRYPRLGASVKQ